VKPSTSHSTQSTVFRDLSPAWPILLFCSPLRPVVPREAHAASETDHNSRVRDLSSYLLGPLGPVPLCYLKFYILCSSLLFSSRGFTANLTAAAITRDQVSGKRLSQLLPSFNSSLLSFFCACPVHAKCSDPSRGNRNAVTHWPHRSIRVVIVARKQFFLMNFCCRFFSPFS
jgi:hypothetical protein